MIVLNILFVVITLSDTETMLILSYLNQNSLLLFFFFWNSTRLNNNALLEIFSKLISKNDRNHKSVEMLVCLKSEPSWYLSNLLESDKWKNI